VGILNKALEYLKPKQKAYQRALALTLQKQKAEQLLEGKKHEEANVLLDAALEQLKEWFPGGDKKELEMRILLLSTRAKDALGIDTQHEILKLDKCKDLMSQGELNSYFSLKASSLIQSGGYSQCRRFLNDSVLSTVKGL